MKADRRLTGKKNETEDAQSRSPSKKSRKVNLHLLQNILIYSSGAPMFDFIFQPNTSTTASFNYSLRLGRLINCVYRHMMWTHALYSQHLKAPIRCYYFCIKQRYMTCI